MVSVHDVGGYESGIRLFAPGAGESFMFIYTAGQPNGEFTAESQALASLAQDFQALGAGLPVASARDNAPMLQDARIVAMTVPCLLGRATGHPLLPGTGRSIVTSQLWAISVDLEWARTRSRWFRLSGGIAVVPEASGRRGN